MPIALPDTALLLQMLALLAVIGAFAGVLAGLLGVGGGIVLVPAFFYAFQTLGYGGPQLMQICLATSLATIIVTSVRSVLSHHRKGAVEWAILRGWAPGIAVGAVLGVLVGIGGGSFGVPLMSLYGIAIHRAVATAAGFGVTIALPSVIAFLFLSIDPAHRPPLTFGAVNLVAFAVVVAMTLVTAPLGVRLAHAMDPKPLKRVFAVFLTLVALNMLRKSLGW
jgi:uncharacterized membrane protein YfcA